MARRRAPRPATILASLTRAAPISVLSLCNGEVVTPYQAAPTDFHNFENKSTVILEFKEIQKEIKLISFTFKNK